MKVYETQKIRNIALLGHAGAGKSTIAESILFMSGAINRKGSIEEHNSVSDYNEIEQERNSSLFATPLYTEWNDFKINMIDTPGYNDYIGELIAAVNVVDTGIIAINAQNAIEVGTENAWLYSEKRNLPVMFLINKLDFDQANFDKASEEIISRYGRSATIFQYPLQVGANFNSIVDVLSMKLIEFSDGKPSVKDLPASEKDKVEKLHNELVESIAESNEELMEKYLDNGELEESELLGALSSAITQRMIYPILCCSSKLNVGITSLLDFIQNYLPNPSQLPIQNETETEVKCDTISPTSLFIFKLVSEAHLGDMIFFRVNSGKVTSGLDLINEQRSSSERLNQLFVVCGKKRAEIPQLNAGDIGATVKLKNTGISDTLHEKGFDVLRPRLSYPEPIVRIAVVPKTKGEEEKVGMSLHSLEFEDPSYKVEHSQELRQIILHSQGELHQSAAKWRLEHRYKVETEFIEPRVPYRETIQKQVKGSYRHKKQSGGAGQFAEVHMMIDPWFENMPNPEGLSVRGKDLIDLEWGGKLEYVNSIVGGVIDQRFLPAILKGVMDKMTFGPLTGCYVRDIRVTIYDGKMHPVDSNEAAFKTAGMMVFKENFVKADPKILEPIYNIEIRVPEEFVGDVMSDLPTRRGLILGIESEGRYQIIKARMPLAELDKYSTALRSMTQAKATYKQEFAEYQTVPPNVQIKLIEDYKKKQVEE